MSQVFTFNEAGVIPGIPGTFAGVTVEVADDGTFTVTPLAQHPAFEPEAEDEVIPEEAPAEAETTPEEEVPAEAESAPAEEAPVPLEEPSAIAEETTQSEA